MALKARLINVEPDPSDSLQIRFEAEYFDESAPDAILFTSPPWAQPVDTAVEEIEKLAIDYGVARYSTAQQASALAGHEVDAVSQPDAAVVQVLADQKAAADAAAAQAEADAAAAEAERIAGA